MTLKYKVDQLEKKQAEKLHWSGVAFIDKPSGTMEIPLLGFVGTVEDGYKKLKSMSGDVVIIIDDIPCSDEGES